jgi:hypothetical protein
MSYGYNPNASSPALLEKRLGVKKIEHSPCHKSRNVFFILYMMPPQQIQKLLWEENFTE